MANENFIDYVKIFCHSGKGGAGSAHLSRTAQNPKAGPDGGDGGKGGDVIFKGNQHLWTLLHLRYTKHIFAKNGENGAKQKCFGKDGKNAIIEVPLGTIIKDAETGETIGEIIENNETLVAMKGGRGGLGNVHFKSATHQTPRFAQPGEEGTEGWLILELKILADVGLVGFPNAGKSTLISVISNAKPKIADYPFTTLKPNLGMVAYRDFQSFVVADIPGIIEGASEGKGLGIRFLRHIERNAILLFLIPAISENISKEYNILLKELQLYNPELIDKKRIVAISKCDLLPEYELKKLKNKLPKDIPSILISSHTQMNIIALKDLIWKHLKEEEKE